MTKHWWTKRKSESNDSLWSLNFLVFTSRFVNEQSETLRLFNCTNFVISSARIDEIKFESRRRFWRRDKQLSPEPWNESRENQFLLVRLKSFHLSLPIVWISLYCNWRVWSCVKLNRRLSKDEKKISKRRSAPFKIFDSFNLISIKF